MTNTLRLASRFSEHDPCEEGSSSRLAKLDSLIEEAEQCSQLSRYVTVGEFESLRKRSAYLLDEFGPDCRKLRDSLDRGNSKINPVSDAKAGEQLPPKVQRFYYRQFARLIKVLKQARRVCIGQPSYRARHLQREDGELKRMIGDTMRRYPKHPSNARIWHREICGRVDDTYAKAKKPVPIPPSWKKAGANNLVSAYDHPKLHKPVKIFLSKINNPPAS